MKLPIAPALLVLTAGIGHAQDNSLPLYHVEQQTFGCANPTYTRTLTNPQEARRANRRWVHDTMSEGRCVTITPRSPWKLVSLEGDVALMAYAGDAGPPGAYYLNVSELVDGAGQHPGESAETSSAPSPSGSPTDRSSATALAPSLVSSSASHPGDDLPPLQPGRQSSLLTAISWIVAAIGFVVLAAILTWHTRRLNRIEQDHQAGASKRASGSDPAHPAI